MFDKLMDRIGWSAHASRRGVAMIQPDLTWVSFSVSLAGDVCFAARLLFIQIFLLFLISRLNEDFEVRLKFQRMTRMHLAD